MPGFVNLKGILDALRDQRHVDSEEFARIVFDPVARLEALTVNTSNAPIVEKFIATQAYARSAASILGKALELNSDESLVLRWFNHERLRDFSQMTPAEII